MADAITDEERRKRRLASEQKYRAANQDKIREQRRQYRQKNAEKLREQRRQERLADPERFRERTRRWRAANPEKVREQSRRRAPLRENMTTIHGREWPADYAAFWEAQGGRCYLCGDPLREEVRPSGRGRDTVIDHDHRCCPDRRSCRICRRGLACTRCNTVAGLLGDDPALMRKIAGALEIAQAIVTARLGERAVQAGLF